ncbi:hypothetical protein [Caballeronia sp. LZ016]|uniref:hypothetical protein n=1 Tax=Caballeronia sp. LZ016 TaxID=3038554 RepID=UPI0028572522|nr:hypothetical protein [Caballeronia sp. LZ016]MDR5740175.1 hypothetical protein [Caballeronia sp. LZ016]
MTELGKTNAPSDEERRNEGKAPHPTAEQIRDNGAQDALDGGDKAKIDKVLDQLNVTTTDSGKDQSRKPDTEGSNSSSKNLDGEND